MEKILFIVPPHLKFDSFINPAFNARAVHKNGKYYGSVLTDMPLSVLALSAYVKKYIKVETRLIDFNIALNSVENFAFSSFGAFFENVLQSWKEYAPTIIGISALFTPSYQNALQIARCCRAIFPKAIIIGGGAVPTNMYNDIYRDSQDFDALCYGEGEKPLLNLLKADNKSQYFQQSPSWITREKLNTKYKFEFDFIANLDEIPFLDYDISNSDEYALNPAITAYNGGVNEKSKNFHIMTSRGCPHRCSFCSSHTVHGRAMRYYSVDRVKEDFTRLKEQYGARTFIFQDDHLMGDKKRALKIINLLPELGVEVVFQNSLALYALDRNMLEAIRNAGVRQLVLSVESGSDRVLKEVMHKPLNLSIIKRVSDDCRVLGIYTNVNVLIGLPGETKQDIEDARAFLKTINANWYLIFCATPLVGSEMYDICKANNYLTDDYSGCDYKQAAISTEDFTAQYIQEMAYFLNLELNFVQNSDFRLGHFDVALKGFESAIRAKSDHAFAYAYAAKCYTHLGDLEKAKRYSEIAETIVQENIFWKNYLEKFNLKISDLCPALPSKKAA